LPTECFNGNVLSSQKVLQSLIFPSTAYSFPWATLFVRAEHGPEQSATSSWLAELNQSAGSSKTSRQGLAKLYPARNSQIWRILFGSTPVY
jgi:hypothetical protein